MLSKVKVQGKTVSEAISKGLRELNLRRDQVEVTVLEHPKKGFLGIGSKPAVVEVHKKRWVSDSLDSAIYMDVPRRHGNSRRGKGRTASRRGGRRTTASTVARTPRVHTPKVNEPQRLPSEAIQHATIPEKLTSPMQMAKEYVENVLAHMGVKAENVHVWWDEKQQRILVTFDCDKPAIVIGKEGKTLEAIQYLATLAVTRKFDTAISVIADTQNYWRKAEDKIDSDIERAIDMIKRGNSVFRFRPMSSQLRRYIHRSVEGNEYVQTASEGEGKWRKVTFRPTQKALDEAKAGTASADFVPGVIGEDLPVETEQAPVTEVAVASTPVSPVATTDETNDLSAQTPTEVSTAENSSDETIVPAKDETPTQHMASLSVAATVAHSVVETDTHTVEEHSVVLTTKESEEK